MFMYPQPPANVPPLVMVIAVGLVIASALVLPALVY